MTDAETEETTASSRAASPAAVLAYLSPRGRITRWSYLIGFVAPCLTLAGGLSGIVPRASVTGMAIFLLIYWVFMAGLAKRLQDLGLPGTPIAAVLVIGFWMQLESGLELPDWLQTYAYAAIAVGVLFAATTSGEPRANRFGRVPPLRRRR